MRYEFNFRPAQFQGYTEFDEFKEFNFETSNISPTTCTSAMGPGVVGRYCPEYRRWVQQSLNRILGLQLVIDGDFRLQKLNGQRTISALKSFQQRSGLAPDGKGSPKTEAALIKAGALPPPVSFPSSPASAAGAAKSSPWVRGLLPLLECYRGDIPLDFLVGWVAVETGGCVGDISRIDERGYFQIHPGELKRIKVDGQSVDRALLVTGPKYSVKAGIQLVRYYMWRAKNVLGLQPGTDLFWRMVKFQHTGTGYVKVILDAMRRDGKSPTSWEAIRKYVKDNTDKLSKHKFFLKRDPNTLIKNVDKLFERGRELTPRRNGGASQELHMETANGHGAEFELNLEAEPFEGYTEFDELDRFEAEAGVANRSSADYLRWVQRSLNRVLGLLLRVDGQMGTQTRSAVRGFQQRRGLRADGNVGPQTERALVAAGTDPPPGAGTTPPSPSSVPRSTPDLVKREASPPGYTLYVNLALGVESPTRPMTGIFIPQDFRPGPQVDLILYLHGFKQHPALTIDGYWNTRQFPYWSLREGVNESRKNVILVAPTLGPRSQTGWLTKPGGFTKYLDQVKAALATYGPYKETGQVPSLGNIILSCHSGGGWPMRQLALSGQRYASQIIECWGFDCTYNRGDDTEWARWAKSRPDARLYIYYIAHSQTQALSLSLKRHQAPNVFVAPSPARGHNWVPITHWRERIQAAAFLRNV